MATNYAYIFACIDLETNMCIGIETTDYAHQDNHPEWVSIPVEDEGYLFKYYNWDNGKFYYDPEYTQEYISPLL